MLRLGWLIVAAAVGAARPAAAAERWLLTVEAPAAIPVSQPQRSLFGPGALPAVTAYRSVARDVLVGLRLRGGAFLDGSPPADPDLRDPGMGGLGGLTVALRGRPLAFTGDSRAVGLWVELGGGAALTGKLLRGTVEAGLGWNYQAGALALGPAVRYLQVIQPADPLDGRDARMVLVGLEVTFFDSQPPPALARPAGPGGPR